MQEAIGAYRHVAATDEFKEIERLRSRARHNEAAALRHARNEGRNEGRNEERNTFVQNALRKKLSVETIAELTGISITEIEVLASET